MTLPNGDLTTVVARLWPEAGESPRIEPVSGGRNHRGYRVDGAGERAFLKIHYSSSPDTPCATFETEIAFLRYLAATDIGGAPRLRAYDHSAHAILTDWIDGRSIEAVREEHIEAALAWIETLQRHRARAGELPLARESAFSLAEHRVVVARRVASLVELARDDHPHAGFRDFVLDRLAHAWQEVAATVPDDATPIADRVISPSDFGFHNALETDDGLFFFDFEYAGWDDPAKLICDFFAQPQLPVPDSARASFTARVAAMTEDPAAVTARAQLLAPLFAVKWCCILLNEFRHDRLAQREFATAGTDLDTQLAHAEAKLEAETL